MVTTAGTDELLTNNPALVIVDKGPEFHGNPDDTVKAGSPTTSEGFYLLSAGTSWDNEWELMVDLLVTLHTTPQEVVASIYLGTLELEYGAGASVTEAVQDLLTSLSDYYKSLECREDTLGEPGTEDLSRLRSLVRIKSNH